MLNCQREISLNKMTKTKYNIEASEKSMCMFLDSNPNIKVLGFCQTNNYITVFYQESE